jgi:hypothetical protein
MRVLDALKNSSELIEIALTISTPEALVNFLKHRTEVFDVRRAVENGAVKFAEIDFFVRSLFGEFEKGKKFLGDIIISALAISLELIPARDAESFLYELAQLRLSELPMSSRVAKIAIHNRNVMIGGLTFRKFRITDPLPLTHNPQLWIPPRSNIGRSDQIVRIEAGNA